MRRNNSAEPTGAFAKIDAEPSCEFEVRSEAEAAQKLFRLNWLLITLALAAFDLLLLLTDFRIRPNGYLIALTAAAIYGVCGHLNANSARSRPWIFSMLTGIAQMIMVVAVMTSMTYIAAAATFPLQDARLLAFDRAIGFDFRAFVTYVNARDWLIGILAAGYRAISWPILLNVVVLSLAGRYLQTGKFVLAFLIALLATTCVTVFVPAIGAYGVAGVLPSDYSNFEPQGYLDTMRDVPLLRDGNLRALDLFQLGGVVTFPSFHAAAAVLYAWALWPIRWIRWLALLPNAAMLVATPIGGGHFLADVIAGVIVAGLSILAACRIGSMLASTQGTIPSRRWLPIGSTP
jgi:PAP2 superfamily protein